MAAVRADLVLTCRLCGDAFVFSPGEQELQALRGVAAPPTRCPTCRRRPPTAPWLPALAPIALKRAALKPA